MIPNLALIITAYILYRLIETSTLSFPTAATSSLSRTRHTEANTTSLTASPGT
ncbi:MAG: hypothetical protein ABSG23_03930 [Terriglobales bacterium]|jgi:hypothetical protein